MYTMQPFPPGWQFSQNRVALLTSKTPVRALWARVESRTGSTLMRRWHLIDPKYVRITCDRPGCEEQLTLPTVDRGQVKAAARDAGWSTQPREVGGFVLEEDYCAQHTAD